ncbi:MAG TPA: zf-HC2 domain-containing protein [Fimbriimonadaceae bacterium]|nr:zf-HC2 domain-containing protein [Fimbriimonadaceae bacterium]
MNCEKVRLVLGAYHDGELNDRLLEAEIAAHLEGCPDCRARLTGIARLSEAVRDQGHRFVAPKSLEKRFAPKRWPTALPLAAAAVLLLVCLGLFYAMPRPDTVALMAIDSHVRSFQNGHLIDVASSDKHTVKPWFQGKLDFSPSVPDLRPAGFELKGGRLDYLSGTACAVLVYGYKKHVISVYVAPSARTESWPSSRQIKGFNWEMWTVADLRYGAISDASEDIVRRFADVFQDTVRAPASDRPE